MGVKMVLNETIFQNETLGDWRESYTVDWWTCLITSVLILVQSLYWLNSTFGGIGTIQDLLCGLAEATAEDGWRNVDYITEAAVFFSYWTFLPYISMSFCVISALNGIVGIIGLYFHSFLVAIVVVSAGARRQQKQLTKAPNQQHR